MLFTNIGLAALNALLKHNEGSVQLLKQYAGKSFSLNVVGITMLGLIDIDGLLIAPEDQNALAVNIIVPAAVLSHVVTQDKLALVREIYFVGDREFGLKLLEIFANLQFSGIYAELPPWSGAVAYQLEQICAGIKNYLVALFKNAALSMSEYLVYESRDIVSGTQIEQFCDEVDELRNRMNLLECRITKQSKAGSWPATRMCAPG